MKFRNYCLILIGNKLEEANIEIQKVCESGPNVIHDEGLLIATFSSVVEPDELKEWFILNNRNFFLFDLDQDGTKFNISIPHIHDGLFSFLNTINLDDKRDELLREVLLNNDKSILSAKTKNTLTRVENEISFEEIDEMSGKEKDNLWNKIIDKGVENITDHDKKILQYLSK